VGKQHTRWSNLKTPICGACGAWVQITHANFEAQQFEHQNMEQMSCVVLCCVVDYVTLTWKQGCSDLRCWCKVFILHISNLVYIFTSQKTLQAWCIAEKLYLK
jgi:hypothetical protein